VTSPVSISRSGRIEGVAIALYVAILAVQLSAGLRHTGGTFVYAQDDPYIHLSIARTLADHAVWGIRPDDFAAASSSPLWTLLLALLWALGVHGAWMPFLINVACGVAVILLVARILASSFDGRATLAMLAALIVCVPLTTLALVGMEHSLQILVVLAFAWHAARLAGGDEHIPSSRLPVLAMLLTAVRYEGLFVVAAASVVLWQRRRRRETIMVLAAAAIPVLAAGTYFVWHGGTILPNSLLMKSVPARFGTFGGGVTAVLSDWASMIVVYRRPVELSLLLATLAGLALAPERPRVAWTRPFAEMYVITLLLHSALVKLEFFYRYEAYLVAFGGVAIALVAAEVARRERRPVLFALPSAAIVAVLAIPLAIRAISAATETPLAMRNVFEQQYQMGLLFRDKYAGVPIAINDIGAVGWMSSSPILDVYGLASQQVADLKRHKAWTSAALERLAFDRGVRAAGIYERALAPLIPTTWILVGEWRIRDNVAVSEDTVGFYAPTPADVPRLRNALDDFAPRLPSAVTYRALSDVRGSGPTGR
jgi:hypothetical protein